MIKQNISHFLYMKINNFCNSDDVFECLQFREKKNDIKFGVYTFVCFESQ